MDRTHAAGAEIDNAGYGSGVIERSKQPHLECLTSSSLRIFQETRSQNLQQLLQVEGTILLHFGFAARQDQVRACQFGPDACTSFLNRILGVFISQALGNELLSLAKDGKVRSLLPIRNLRYVHCRFLHTDAAITFPAFAAAVSGSHSAIRGEVEFKPMQRRVKHADVHTAVYSTRSWTGSNLTL